MKKISINQDWLFHYQETPGARLGGTEFSDWRELDLPHDWSIELPRSADQVSSSSGGYFPMGCGWYEKTIKPSSDWQGKKVFILFEGVYMNSTVWLDHHCIGRYPYGYSSHSYELTPYLNWEKPNRLRVFVDNSHQLNSRWYSGSGIFRPVWLIIADPVHIARWGVFVTTPVVDHEAATVVINTQVDNKREGHCEVTLQSRVLTPDRDEIHIGSSEAALSSNGRHEFQTSVEIKNPQLWSPDTPALYQLISETLVDGVVTDCETTHFGIRSIAFSAERGFTLNGEPLLLKGGCVHHDHGILGAASYTQAEERKVRLHKENGYNAIRCAHNPPAPAFLDACDRFGMLVIDEAFDCWQDGKNNGDYHVAFNDWWQRDLDAMVYRDRNHPSIIMWSIGNEVLERDGYGGGYDISSKLAAYVREADPTRPVTAAICSSWRGDAWTIMDPAFETLDVGGYNYMWKEYRSDQERLPERIMMGTESFALEAFENWRAVQELPAVIGDFVWTSLDYLGEAGIGRVHYGDETFPFLGDYPWHQANCGDLDLCGHKRPQSFYRDMLWQGTPKVYIAVHPPAKEGKKPNVTAWGWPDVWPDWNWRGQEGKPFQVEVYANCEEVEVILNGKSLGRKPSSQNEEFRATFEVPYEAGELTAIGYRQGAAVVEEKLQTTGSPAKIRLLSEQNEIFREGDLAYIRVEILDSENLLHPTAENTIYFTVNGPGKILAVGNANPISEESYVGNQRRAFRGRALVVVKSVGDAGEIQLTAQADGLAAAMTKVKVREF